MCSWTPAPGIMPSRKEAQIRLVALSTCMHRDACRCMCVGIPSRLHLPAATTALSSVVRTHHVYMYAVLNVSP